MKIRGKILLPLAILGIVLLWLSTYGVNKAVERTISVDVYEDNDWSYTTSTITISGKVKRTLFSTKFAGTFAIDCYEPSCQEGVEARIRWYDSNHQEITFLYAGEPVRSEVERINITSEMDRMMVVLEDGTIITSPNYYIPTQIWKQYKG